MNQRAGLSAFAFLLLAAAVPQGRAWDYEGHRIVNQLALASLPADFPAFVHEPAAAERIAFLASEPDRWKNVSEPSLRHENIPDHYFDTEQIEWAGLDPEALSPLRYEFAMQFAAGREAHAARFPRIDPARNAEHIREWPGFLPWTITEYFGRLKSAFSYLRAFEEAGATPVEISNARANVVYLMGVMGHYVGDGAQPLHVTVHHSGWTGPNPHGYTTDPKFHAWIDGGFIAQAGITFGGLAPRARPARLLATNPGSGERDGMFAEVIRYLEAQFRRVEPLYRLEKAGGFAAGGPSGSPEGRDFIDEQLLRGGEMLGSIWLTAWRTSQPDRFMLDRLSRRAAAVPVAN